ncbi:MAG TPA: 4-(cytidine 5'-diphospho)-2-C-methyl-D-erythritol kinase [Candidatus Sulfotelmatobacter sp.]|nr:4-(cytidine 5'-diphospho)-2-C-methyl-D-erythritol kinase [Candidatus Sulfotelmatobacter sp.]
MRSYAKINLGLLIGAPRADGFHELLTVYQTIALHDILRITVERGSGIEIRCADPRVPRDETNTCHRMAERAMHGLRARGRVLIEIQKRLPVQGGLGGASSNAVATLLGMERALRKTLPAEEKLRIAAEIGSDLPLFLVGGTVLGVGRGERVYPLQDLPAIPCVIVTPQVGVSTPRAFARWDQICGAGDVARQVTSERKPPRPQKVLELRRAGQPPADAIAAPTAKLTVSGSSDRMYELGCGLSAWLSEQYSGAPFGRGRAENPLLALVRAGIKNDFEQVVLPEYPELGEAKTALLRAGAKYASLSGSGSTLYGLFGSKAAAAVAVNRLRKQGWAAQASTTLTRSAYRRRIFDC